MPTRDELLERDDPAPVQAEERAVNPVNIPELNPFGLTEQELKFAWAYACWEHGARAAEYAGYEGSSSTASKLLNDSRIRGEVIRMTRKRMKFKSERPVDPNATDIMQLWQDVAFADHLDLLIQDTDGKVRYKALADIPQSLRNAIKAVDVHKDGTVRIHLMDRMQALQALSRYVGMGTKFLPGDGKTVSEQTADEAEAQAAAKGEMTPLPSMPLSHANVVKMNAHRLQQGVLGGTKS